MAKYADSGAVLQELKTALKAKTPNRLYFFHGEEMFLLRHYLGQLKKQLVDDLTESFNYTRLNNENFTMQAFADAVEFYTDAACTKGYDPFADTDSDLTVYIKWGE